MKKILILGGNGFIGSNLSDTFVNSGNKVIVFDKEKTNYKNKNSYLSKIKTISGDFRDENLLKKIFDENQINIVIHLISTVIPGTKHNDVVENMDINLISTMKLIDIMIKKKVNNIIFFSSGGAIYGMNGKNINREDSETAPINYYGWLKLTIEKYIQMCHNLYGLNYIILRPSNAYGTNQNIYGNQGLIAVTLGNLIRKKKIEIWGNGKIIRDYIYINDLCRALSLLIKNNKWNDIYNVGSGKGVSVNEVLKIIKKITNIDFDINHKKSRKIDIPVNILDASKLKNDTNWSNLTGLQKGIGIMWKELNNTIKK